MFHQCQIQKTVSESKATYVDDIDTLRVLTEKLNKKRSKLTNKAFLKICCGFKFAKLEKLN